MNAAENYILYFCDNYSFQVQYCLAVLLIVLSLYGFISSRRLPVTPGLYPSFGYSSFLDQSSEPERGLTVLTLWTFLVFSAVLLLTNFPTALLQYSAAELLNLHILSAVPPLVLHLCPDFSHLPRRKYVNYFNTDDSTPINFIWSSSRCHLREIP